MINYTSLENVNNILHDQNKGGFCCYCYIAKTMLIQVIMYYLVTPVVDPSNT